MTDSLLQRAAEGTVLSPQETSVSSQDAYLLKLNKVHRLAPTHLKTHTQSSSHARGEGTVAMNKLPSPIS